MAKPLREELCGAEPHITDRRLEVGTVYKYELPKPFAKRIQVTVEPLE